MVHVAQARGQTRSSMFAAGWLCASIAFSANATSPAWGVALDESLVASLRGATAPHIVTIPAGAGRTVTLELEPIQPLAAGARFVAASRDADGALVETALAAPSVHLYRGRIIGPGEPGGPDGAATRPTAFIAVGSRGVDGWMEVDGHVHLIGSGALAARVDGANLPTLVFDPTTLPSSALRLEVPTCGAELLDGYSGATWTWDEAAAAAQGGVAGAVCRTATIAVETDSEFLGSLFGGDAVAASEYAVTLIAAASEIFARDCSTQLQVNFVRLWTTPDDPWTMTNTYDQLFEWRDWWVANMASQPRDLVHFLSGRGLGGGIAWLPGTCSGDYGYGLSANLGGSFPYPLEDHNGQNWDVMVVAHELGHNFGAPHTHSMKPPIDGCGNGDCSDAFNGTIMSYCHTCAGGMTNVNLKFAPGTIEAIVAHLDSEGGACVEIGDNPLAVDDLASTIQDAAIVLDVLANDAAASCANQLVLEDFTPQASQGGAVSLCAGCGANGGDALTYSPAVGFSGIDTVGYSVSAGTASVVTGTATVDVLALLPAITPAIPRPGLAASYYALPELDVLPDFSMLKPSSNEIAPLVDFPSTDSVFAGSGLAELVGAVFEGYVVVPVNGSYTFFLESDDGSRLVVDGVPVLINDGLHAMVEKSGVVALEAGAHAVRIEFFERYGGAGLIARIAGPTLEKRVVPASMLRHEGTADLDGNGLVDGADLGIMLGAWGTGDPWVDLNGDGTVNGADLGILLGAWGSPST